MHKTAGDVRTAKFDVQRVGSHPTITKKIIGGYITLWNVHYATSIIAFVYMLCIELMVVLCIEL